MPRMSNAPTAATAPIHPGPDRAVSARLDSAGVGNILRLLRALFAYGSNLVETLRQNDYPEVLPWYPFLATIFGSTNPALITVIVTRGLLRLTALQRRLSSSLACARYSLLRLPLRDDRPAKRIDGGRRPGGGQSHAAGSAIPPGRSAGETSLGREPTPEQEIFAEIVERDRDRQIAAILLDICLNLGIVSPLMEPATRGELVHDLTRYGSDPATLPSGSADVQNSTDPATPAPVGEARSAGPRLQSSRRPHPHVSPIPGAPRKVPSPCGARPITHRSASHTARTGRPTASPPRHARRSMLLRGLSTWKQAAGSPPSTSFLQCKGERV